MAKSMSRSQSAINRAEKKTATPFEKECLDTLKKIIEYKLIAEANSVSSIYNARDLIRVTSLN